MAVADAVMDIGAEIGSEFGFEAPGMAQSTNIERSLFETAQQRMENALNRGMKIGETVGRGIDRAFKIATVGDIGYRAFKDVMGDDDQTPHLPSIPTDPNKPPPIAGADQPNIYIVYGDQAKQQWGNIPKYPHEPKKYGRRGKRSKTHNSKGSK